MKKITTFMLLTAMLASMASCGGDAPAADTTAPSADTTEAVTTDDGLEHDNLGDIKFEGETFTMWFYAKKLASFYVEEETGDILEDSIFARNRAVEERLGVELEFIETGLVGSGADQATACKMIESNILAGDATADIYLHVQHSNMPNLVNSQYFVDWKTIPNVDLTKPYWCRNAIDDINYGSKVFLMTGFYDYNVLAGANCLIFNKRILDESKIEYPYQSVIDGTWTYDAWKEIITATTRDLNGDTTYDAANDQYGYIGRLWECPYTFFVGMGGDLLTKDKENMPVDIISTERNVDIIDRLLDIATSTPGAMIAPTVPEMTEPFISGRVATIHHSLSFIPTSCRDMKDDFGFVPAPKYDEAQEDYNVWINNATTMSYVPITNDRLDLTGAVLEVMACESYNNVIPAYVDTVLTVKATRDEESAEMVPFIIERASFFDHALHALIELPNCIVNNISLATFYAQKQSQITEFLKTLAETYK